MKHPGEAACQVSRQPAGEVHATPLVTIVLLSYNRPQYLVEVLDSIVRQSYKHLEVLVVDNQSPASEQVRDIVGRYPDSQLIACGENLGFTGGMNLGIQLAHGEYIHLTEDDIVLDKDCIWNLVEYTSAQAYGLLSGVMYNKREGTIRCAGGHVSLGSVFRMDVHGAGQPDHGQFAEARDVNYIPGAMIFASRPVWRRLGGFREDFFMYSEDTELCFRAQRLGYRITVVPTAKVFHFEPGEGDVPDQIKFHKLKNFFAVYVLHAPGSVLIPFFVRNLLLNLLPQAITNPKQSGWMFRAIRATIRALPQLLRQRGCVRRDALYATNPD